MNEPMPAPMRLLVNLPPGFFTAPLLAPQWARLETAVTEVAYTSANTAEEILAALSASDAVLMWSWPMLTEDLLDRCPSLRFAANIDITQTGARILLARGIPASLSRRGFSPAVSEMALTLILSCLRRTPTYHAAMWSGAPAPLAGDSTPVAAEPWVKRFPDDVPASERQLTGRRVGIVGFGGVGQRLAELLQPFHCEIQVYDPYLPDTAAASLGVERVPLEQLVRRSEVLVLCAAANAGTKRLIDAEMIAAMPAGAVLVNVARAALVDADALLARLARGDLYAALDVFDQEPLPADSPFRGLPNCYLTPHRAGGVWESVERIVSYLIDDIVAFQSGLPRRYALTEAMVSSLDA
jgi:phosphoglycerate dehydrogenase-like enzyme